ncbi:hypothetical protein KKG45_04030, partial [bacterium]|nr:hypothetical protein [bacterium]
ALQIDRAVAAVHGGPPPDPARYADLEMNGAQGAAACCSGFDLQDSRGRGSELRAKTFALLVAVFCLVGIPLLLLGTLSLDPRALEWVRTRAALAAAMVPLGLFAALLLMSAFSDVGTWAQAAWLMITLRRAAESLPLSAGQCWTGVAAVLALCYLIMQERFARLEASHALVKKKQQENY